MSEAESESDNSSSTSNGDFSDNSEDDWHPGDEDHDEESDHEASDSPSPSKKQRCKASLKPTQVLHKDARATATLSKSIKDLLNVAQAQPRQKLSIKQEEAGCSKMQAASPKSIRMTFNNLSDSGSSEDENLLLPRNLNLTESLGAIDHRNLRTEIGISADSYSDLGDCTDETSKVMDVMRNLKNFSTEINKAKETLRQYEDRNRGASTNSKDALDVNQLLAQGEVSELVTKQVSRKTRRPPAKEDSGSEWEEVEDIPSMDPDHPTEEVLVRLDFPDHRRKRIQDELETALKRQLNKEKREQQLKIHQAAVQEWLDQGNHINGILNDTDLFQLALRLLPSAQAYPKDKVDRHYFAQICKWYAGAMHIYKDATMFPPLLEDLDLKASLRVQIEKKLTKSKRNFILIFILLLRAIGLQCRLVINLKVPPIRPPQSELCRITNNPKSDAKRTPVDTSNGKTVKKNGKRKTPPSIKPDKGASSNASLSDSMSKSTSERKKKARLEVDNDSAKVSAHPRTTRAKIPAVSFSQLDGMDDGLKTSSPVSKRTRSRTPNTSAQTIQGLSVPRRSVDSPIGSQAKRNKNSIPVAAGDLFAKDPTERVSVRMVRGRAISEDVGAPAKKCSRVAEVKKIDRRVLSTDDEAQAPQLERTKTDFWVEVWSEREECWLCVDLFKPEVSSKGETVLRNASQPIVYVLAWNNNCSVRDVTLRYCPQWHSLNRKLRADQAWVDALLKPHTASTDEQKLLDQKEDQDLAEERQCPIPKAISEFKNHPLYALERHLLKFEGIYPPNAPTLGFIRNEPIYARECVHTLHSREIWVKQARVVKVGETPYKVVKARPKYEKSTNTVIKDQPLELFGIWQTKEYEPPVAENGIVPKNAYGNVELFQPCMLPINTVHLPYAGVNKVCKRLNIDYAPAVVGFDFHGGFSHPVYEGYVVCKEFAELVTDEWVKDTELAAKREAEKLKERVYNNWRRIIRSLLIKKRLQVKYNFGEDETN